MPTHSKIEKALKSFTDTLSSPESPSELAGSLGKALIDICNAARGSEDGISEEVEKTAEKEFGNGVPGEAGKAFFGVMGEVAEAAAEVTLAVGTSAGVTAGNLVQGAGLTYGNLFEAGYELRQGDFGGAAAELFEAVESIPTAAVVGGKEMVKGLFIGTAEAIEGGFSIGWTALKGAGSIAAAAGREVVELIEPQVPLFPAQPEPAPVTAPSDKSPNESNGETCVPGDGLEAATNESLQKPNNDDPNGEVEMPPAAQYLPASDELTCQPDEDELTTTPEHEAPAQEEPAAEECHSSG